MKEERRADYMSNEVQKKPHTMVQLLESMAEQIKAALPNDMDYQRFSRIVLTAIRTTPRLGACTETSFLAAMIQSAQLGLEPNTSLGHAWLIPYRNNQKGVIECQFQIGYQGLLALAYRSGMYDRIGAYAVYPGQSIEYEYGLNPKLIHKPGPRTGDPTHYYALYTLKNGGSNFEVWTKEEVEAHMRRYSKSWQKKSSAWQTNFPRMAMKTVLISLLKYAPKSVELSRATAADNRAVKITSEPGNNIEISPEDWDIEDDEDMDEIAGKAFDEEMENDGK
jgi:recombination protein RecT